MLNFGHVTERERKEAAKIQAKRAFEEERRKRIFNPRQRLYGNDYEALQKQIEENKQRREEERRNQQILDQQLIKMDQIAVGLERKEKEERRRMEQDINDYRKFYQRPENRREFDLNDSCKHQADISPQECGPSSIQKFEGEDLMNADRQRLQQEQVRAWLEQQMMEKKAAAKQQEEMDAAYTSALLNRDQRALELEALEKECRRRLDEACNRFNQTLADEKKNAALHEQQKTLEDNLAEMYNLCSSDLLTENPEVSRSRLGANKHIGYLYKGMTHEEVEEIKRFQLWQIEEAKRKRDLERKIQQEYDDYFNGTQKLISQKDKEMEKKLRQFNEELRAENQRLAVEQSRNKESLKKLYVGRAEAEFYDQFNKSTR